MHEACVHQKIGAQLWRFKAGTLLMEENIDDLISVWILHSCAPFYGHRLLTVSSHSFPLRHPWKVDSSRARQRLLDLSTDTTHSSILLMLAALSKRALWSDCDPTNLRSIHSILQTLLLLRLQVRITDPYWSRASMPSLWEICSQLTEFIFYFACFKKERISESQKLPSSGPYRGFIGIGFVTIAFPNGVSISKVFMGFQSNMFSNICVCQIPLAMQISLSASLFEFLDAGKNRSGRLSARAYHMQVNV